MYEFVCGYNSTQSPYVPRSGCLSFTPTGTSLVLAGFLPLPLLFVFCGAFASKKWLLCGKHKPHSLGTGCLRLWNILFVFAVVYVISSKDVRRRHVGGSWNFTIISVPKQWTSQQIITNQKQRTEQKIIKNADLTYVFNILIFHLIYD